MLALNRPRRRSPLLGWPIEAAVAPAVSTPPRRPDPAWTQFAPLATAQDPSKTTVKRL